MNWRLIVWVDGAPLLHPKPYSTEAQARAMAKGLYPGEPILLLEDPLLQQADVALLKELSPSLPRGMVYDIPRIKARFRAAACNNPTDPRILDPVTRNRAVEERINSRLGLWWRTADNRLLPLSEVTDHHLDNILSYVESVWQHKQLHAWRDRKEYLAQRVHKQGPGLPHMGQVVGGVRIATYQQLRVESAKRGSVRLVVGE